MPKSSLRDALVAAGLVEFTIRGYSATGIQAVTDRAGAPRGSFYGHFESKDAFAVEVVAAYVKMLRRRARPDGAIPAADRLRYEFETFAALVETAGFDAGCLLGIFGAERLDEPLRTAVETAVDDWVDRTAATLEQAYTEAGGDVPPDLRDRADDLITGWEAALWRARLSRDRAPLDRFLALTLERALPAAPG
jgi:TetR/AcrR family transcriptional regulator, transcriptional repressor for nem operon